LVGFRNDWLIVWDEENDKKIFKISDDVVFSIKRVLTANIYIINTFREGVKVLTIYDLEAKRFSLKLLLKID
jgi:hypothetical protein